MKAQRDVGVARLDPRPRRRNFARYVRDMRDTPIIFAPHGNARMTAGSLPDNGKVVRREVT